MEHERKIFASQIFVHSTAHLVSMLLFVSTLRTLCGKEATDFYCDNANQSQVLYMIYVFYVPVVIQL